MRVQIAKSGKSLLAHMLSSLRKFLYLPDVDEGDLEESRGRLIAVLCDIQRLKDRAFLPKKVGEICKLSRQDIEGLLVKSILFAVQKEIVAAGLEFDSFYYRRLVKSNHAFQSTLNYFSDLVDQFRALREFYANNQDREAAINLATIDQAEPAFAISLLKPEDKIRFKNAS